MHEAAGSQSFISQSILHIKDQLNAPTPELTDAISIGIGSSDPTAIESTRAQLLTQVNDLAQKVQAEPAGHNKHYVSRFDVVGIFQSALSKIFSDVPNLQSYGDWNPLWIITEIEVFAHRVKSFLSDVHQDVNGRQQPVWAAIVSELLRLKTVDDRAPFPAGVPDTIQLPDACTMVLLADWGGDNDAAKRIAAVVRKQNPDFAIHLGDIYYGGTKHECELFLALWPMRVNMSDPTSPIRAAGSFALNGNHEMYSGGEYFFSTVLPVFEQQRPFFCLENANWRIIGLDTAYAGGRLKPQSADDPMAAQWNWLIDLLKKSKKATIFLTHHQPVSAHQDEFAESQPLRNDIAELLQIDGVGDSAIFGWFFGHEHRCVLYTDTAVQFNARLIGNGCIPHEVQKEKASDPGCTPADYFNRRETAPGSDTAVSSFVKLSFAGAQLLVEYVDETFTTWGKEIWYADKGRLGGSKFVESALVQQ
jgi:predicted phosphodiesterase